MNKFSFFAVIIVVVVYACSNRELNMNKSNVELVEDYFEALNQSDFKEISKLISDSILLTEGGYAITNDIKSYYNFFQWDSVFNPEYQILELQNTDDSSAVLLISKSCLRIKYLHDSATVYKVQFNIDKNQIVKIASLDLVVFDTLKWQSRRDTLVKWINKNHPELNGFQYEQTSAGAQKYLEAIDLFITNSHTDI